MEASSGRWGRAESARIPGRACPFRGLVRPPKAPPAARGRVNCQSERSGTGRMSDFVPGVRWDGAAPAELGGWDAVTSGSSNYPANVLLYTVTYLSSTSGSVVDSCVLLFLRSLLPCFLIFPVRGPSKGLVVGRGGRYSPKGLGWALWYSMVLYGTLWYSARGALVVVRASEPTSVAPLPPRGARSGSLCVSWSGTGRG